MDSLSPLLSSPGFQVGSHGVIFVPHPEKSCKVCSFLYLTSKIILFFCGWTRGWFAIFSHPHYNGNTLTMPVTFCWQYWITLEYNCKCSVVTRTSTLLRCRILYQSNKTPSRKNKGSQASLSRFVFCVQSQNISPPVLSETSIQSSVCLLISDHLESWFIMSADAAGRHDDIYWRDKRL